MTNPTALRVLIAEDDPVQRAALRSWIGELQPTWRIVADADSVDAVRAGIEQHAPDLALVDIHLPGAESADWVKSLDGATPVIYVTGDPEFAVHAFDSAAIDYVLKPVTMRRLKVALDRAAGDPRLVRRAQGAESDGGSALRWITMSRGNEMLVVSLDEVLFLEADMKYTRIMTRRGEGLVRTGINELCERFNDEQFVKIHRGTVVNLRYVASVKRNEMGHLEVHLHGSPEVLRVSKSFQQVFRSF